MFANEEVDDTQLLVQVCVSKITSELKALMMELKIQIIVSIYKSDS